MALRIHRGTVPGDAPGSLRAPEILGTDRVASPYQDSLAAVVRDLAVPRSHTLLVTSSTAGEGKTTVVAELGRALIRAGVRDVLLVDAHAAHPSLHERFSLTNALGLSDLLSDVYLRDPTDSRQPLGTGDWLELLMAQGRTGELLVTEGAGSCRVQFLRGTVWSLVDAGTPEEARLGSLLVRWGCISRQQRDDALRIQQQHRRPLGDVLSGLDCVTRGDLARALQHQIRSRLRRLVAFSEPHCRFSDHSESSSTTGPAFPGVERVDQLVNGRLAPYLSDPFISARIPSYLSVATPLGLRVLTAGSRPAELLTRRTATALKLLLRRLSRLYDVVLVDGPPVTLTTPAASLVPLADQVVLVVKVDGPDVAKIRRAVGELRRAGGTVAGVVLNQVDLDRNQGLSAHHRRPGLPRAEAPANGRPRRGDRPRRERWS